MPRLNSKIVNEVASRIHKAAEFVLKRTRLRPRHALILGTGLSGMTEHTEIEDSIPYEQSPGFPVSTVTGHAGLLHFGRIVERRGEEKIARRVEVAVLEGRFHLYEGYTPVGIAMPIWSLKFIGIKNLLITNASGGLNPLFKAGEIMVIRDHINLTGRNPLIGMDLPEIGPRFPDMTRAYDQGLIGIAERGARKLGIGFNRGVYAGILGPSLETPAETRMLRNLGADAVGMSTVMEVIAAVHAGMKVLGLSVISNVNLPDAMRPILLDDIISVANKTGPDLMRLIKRILLEMHERKEE